MGDPLPWESWTRQSKDSGQVADWAWLAMCPSPGWSRCPGSSSPPHPPTTGTVALPTTGPWHFQPPCPAPSGGGRMGSRKAVWEQQPFVLDQPSGGHQHPFGASHSWGWPCLPISLSVSTSGAPACVRPVPGATSPQDAERVASPRELTT